MARVSSVLDDIYTRDFGARLSASLALFVTLMCLHMLLCCMLRYPLHFWRTLAYSPRRYGTDYHVVQYVILGNRAIGRQLSVNSKPFASLALLTVSSLVYGWRIYTRHGCALLRLEHNHASSSTHFPSAPFPAWMAASKPSKRRDISSTTNKH